MIYQSPSNHFWHWNQTKREKPKTKKKVLESNQEQSLQRESNPVAHLLRLKNLTRLICIYTYRTNRRLGNIDKKIKNSSHRRETMRPRPRSLLARSARASKVRHVQQSARSQVDHNSIYGRLLLKRWSKPDFAMATTTSEKYYTACI